MDPGATEGENVGAGYELILRIEGIIRERVRGPCVGTPRIDICLETISSYLQGMSVPLMVQGQTPGRDGTIRDCVRLGACAQESRDTLVGRAVNCNCPVNEIGPASHR